MTDGRVEVDLTGKMPGRGAYVCKNNDCLEAASKAHRIEKSLKSTSQEGVSDQLKAVLDNANADSDKRKSNPVRLSEVNQARKTVTEDKILSFLGLAARAGQAVSGADAVSAASGKNKVFLFIASDDAAEGTLRLIKRISDDKEIPLRRFSSKNKLGLRLGQRDRAVVAITDKNFADQLIRLLNEYVSGE
jgi:ribosomal protein L7Ae-like RNA K-turn-binding protein/predicted RNA-binding protein YlxR (DUF448 family)